MAVAKRVRSGALCGKTNCFRLSSVFVKRGRLDPKRFTQLSPRSFGLNPNQSICHEIKRRSERWRQNPKGIESSEQNKVESCSCIVYLLLFHETDEEEDLFTSLPSTKNKRNIK